MSRFTNGLPSRWASSSSGGPRPFPGGSDRSASSSNNGRNQHQQQHQQIDRETQEAERQSHQVEDLDFGSFLLPGLGPGDPSASTSSHSSAAGASQSHHTKTQSMMSENSILDLYTHPTSSTDTLGTPYRQQQHQPELAPAPQPPRPQQSVVTSNIPPRRPSVASVGSNTARRSPSGPRPLPSRGNGSTRSTSSSLSSSQHAQAQAVAGSGDPQSPASPSSQGRQSAARPQFPPPVSPNGAYGKTSFDSGRSSSSSDHTSVLSGQSNQRARSVRRGMEVNGLPNEHLSALAELDTPTNLNPSIVATPPLPGESSNEAQSPWGADSASTSIRGGGSHLSPAASFNAHPHLQRNASVATGASYTLTEEDQDRHYNQALLSNMATYLKDRVPRDEHVRGAIPYPMAFTGRDIVSTLERALSDTMKSRRTALHIARSLHSQLFFFEVRDNEQPVQDGLDQVFVFPEDDGGGATWDEIPSAILTEVTPCYSPLCNSLAAQGYYMTKCLSPSCPNNMQASSPLKRQASFMSEQETAPKAQQQDESAWAETVEPELLGILGKKEVDRQNQIHELIVGEATYVRDIELLRTEFLEPLTEADPPIIPADAQSAFFSDVLINAFDIKQQAMTFSEALLQRQREQGPVIQNIGDVVINAALDWGPAYCHYARYYPFADATIKAEKARNTTFDQFLTAFTRRPATRKLAVHSYQTRITIRLQRYILLLKGILKQTPEDNADRPALLQAIDIIDQQCKESDAAVAASEAVLECRRYHKELVGQDGYLSDLQLLDDQRKLIKKGKMYRRSESSGFNDWSTLHVILFDHFFVITKSRSRGSEQRYQIIRRPVPLQLLTPMGFDDPPVPRSSRLNFKSTLASEGPGNHSAKDDHKMLYPITFNYMGRFGGIFTFFVDSAQQRQEWREALIEAIQQKEADMAGLEVFSMSMLSKDVFQPRTRMTQQPKAEPVPYGKPTCSAPFTTPEGHKLLAIGHDDGLWIGLHGDPSSFRLVLYLKGITQCAILQEYGLFLVLAAKVLIAYPLEALVPSASSTASSNRDSREPQRLSGSKDVLFFKVGKIGSRLLVIYVKKDGVTQTVFKALEPIRISERATKGFMRRRTEWFREYKEFFIPSEVFGLMFLRSQLSIVCAKGFELMAIDKEPLRSISFPDWSQLRNDNRAMDLQRRCNESKAVGMFRISDSEFLFAFEDLAFFADKHGDPIKHRYGDVIDWQGTARNVAHIPPYILAFDSNFVEVRHANTGKLVQIIKGSEVSCTNDGQGFGPDTDYGLDKSVEVTLRHVDERGSDSYVVAELVPAA